MAATAVIVSISLFRYPSPFSSFFFLLVPYFSSTRVRTRSDVRSGRLANCFKINSSGRTKDNVRERKLEKGSLCQRYIYIYKHVTLLRQVSSILLTEYKVTSCMRFNARDGNRVGRRFHPYRLLDYNRNTSLLIWPNLTRIFQTLIFLERFLLSNSNSKEERDLLE